MSRAQGRTRAVLLGLALVAAVILAYTPALRAGYIWDDDYYVTRNPWVAAVDGLGAIWTPGNTVQYYPAVFSSFWIQHKLHGLEPFGYHLVNVLLHAASALLVVRLAQRLAIPGAWMIGALFALHPVHVESVAWVTERKNVLSALFYLMAALAYLRFDEARHADDSAAPPHDAGSSRSKRARTATNVRSLSAPKVWRWYAAALACFLAALLSKTVTCSLPAVLVLVFLWQRKPLTARRLAPLVPFLVIGLGLALHTAQLEREHVGADGAEFDFSVAERFLIATKALVFYPTKLLWPDPLVFIYPRWVLEPARPLAWLPAVGLALAAAAAIAAYARGIRGPALALAFFAGTLFPALGFFNVYPMRYSFVADHFQYLASLGILALVVAAGTRWIRPTQLRGVVAALLLLACGVLTWRQSHAYADATTLWNDVIRKNPGAWIAHNNLAVLATEGGRPAEALAHLERALPLVHSEKAARQIRGNIATSLSQLGRREEALRALEALRAEGGGFELELARCLERMQRDPEAETYYRLAVDSPLRNDARVRFAVHLLRRGRAAEAVVQLEAFLAERGDDLDACMFLTDAYAAAGRVPDAIALARRVLATDRARGDLKLRGLIELRIAQLTGAADAAR